MADLLSAPLLTAAEELHLGAMVRQWMDHPAGPGAAPAPVRRRGLRARNRLIVGNLRLAQKLALKYSRCAAALGLTLDDLRQEAAIGLSRAAEKFDPARGYKFSTYAFWWISQALNRSVDAAGLIRIPAGRRQQLRRLSAAELQALPAGKREPLQCAAAAAGRMASIDAPVGGGDGSPLGELLAGDGGSDTLEQLDAAQRVQRLRDRQPGDLALLEQALEHGSSEMARRRGITPNGMNQQLRKARERLQRISA
jgi:RNA polymerase primary sigma factor